MAGTSLPAHQPVGEPAHAYEEVDGADARIGDGAAPERRATVSPWAWASPREARHTEDTRPVHTGDLGPPRADSGALGSRSYADPSFPAPNGREDFFAGI